MVQLEPPVLVKMTVWYTLPAAPSAGPSVTCRPLVGQAGRAAFGDIPPPEAGEVGGADWTAEDCGAVVPELPPETGWLVLLLAQAVASSAAAAAPSAPVIVRRIVVPPVR
jgi:hypothetical protein